MFLTKTELEKMIGTMEFVKFKDLLKYSDTIYQKVDRKIKDMIEQSHTEGYKVFEEMEKRILKLQSEQIENLQQKLKRICKHEEGFDFFIEENELQGFYNSDMIFKSEKIYNCTKTCKTCGYTVAINKDEYDAEVKKIEIEKAKNLLKEENFTVTKKK